MTDVALAQVIDDLRLFVAERDWAQFHDPKNLAMALTSEAGELAALLRWVSSKDSDDWAGVLPNHERLAAEAADVGISLLLLCDRAGIDLLEAIRQKLEQNRRNYPVELVRGRPERPR